jgi:hypothetical protein
MISKAGGLCLWRKKRKCQRTKGKRKDSKEGKKDKGKDGRERKNEQDPSKLFPHWRISWL